MRKKLKICLTLFWVFFRIGAFTFGGGYAMIPLISRETVENKKWISEQDILDIVAIAESTPGPIAINSATFVGYKVAGTLGSVFATLGTVIPSFIIILIISFVLDEFQHLTVIKYAFEGIRAGVLALVLKAFWTMYKKAPKNLISYRRDDIGFVFQFYNLIPNLTALENVELALQICKEPLDAKEVLERVGLGHRTDNFPAQLSGGEQQRVSIARALAKNPKLLLCDEPTGALDYNTGKAILKLLQDTCRNQGMTVILITHNSAIAPMADRVIHIKNGKVSKIITNENPVPVETIEW